MYVSHLQNINYTLKPAFPFCENLRTEYGSKSWSENREWGPLFVLLTNCCFSFITKTTQVVKETYRFIEICDSDNTAIAFDVEKLLQGNWLQNYAMFYCDFDVVIGRR